MAAPILLEMEKNKPIMGTLSKREAANPKAL